MGSGFAESLRSTQRLRALAIGFRENLKNYRNSLRRFKSKFFLKIIREACYSHSLRDEILQSRVFKPLSMHTTKIKVMQWHPRPLSAKFSALICEICGIPECAFCFPQIAQICAESIYSGS